MKEYKKLLIVIAFLSQILINNCIYKYNGFDNILFDDIITYAKIGADKNLKEAILDLKIAIKNENALFKTCEVEKFFDEAIEKLEKLEEKINNNIDYKKLEEKILNIKKILDEDKGICISIKHIYNKENNIINFQNILILSAISGSFVGLYFLYKYFKSKKHKINN